MEIFSTFFKKKSQKVEIELPLFLKKISKSGNRTSTFFKNNVIIIEVQLPLFLKKISKSGNRTPKIRIKNERN